MTTGIATETLEDIQNGQDCRRLAIDRVGVKHLRYPIVVMDRSSTKQETVADLSMAVHLPHHFKGTHMSRFIEVLNEHRGEITMRTLPDLMSHLRARLDAEEAFLEVNFPYFLEKVAPVSGSKSLMEYDCGFAARSKGESTEFEFTVSVPVTSLCPCSKAISDYGAHNQRGTVTVKVKPSRTGPDQWEMVWIEEVIEWVEESASAPVYALLKRSDERYVTMQAYDNPAFVEDIVREVALRLKTDDRVFEFRVEVTNHESIHNHSAYAVIQWQREEDEA